MQEIKTQRNQSVDVVRGVAMLLVVLGHTMTGCTKNSESSFLFDIVWSLQMPLFIIISGYVTKYSREIHTVVDWLKFLKKRTISYILPWLVWTFVIRGLLLNQKSYLNLKYILWNMDSGYWFLATIWTISVIFGTAQFLSNILDRKNRVPSWLKIGGFLILGMLALIVLGKFTGYGFFCIKLTLYYIPFYFIGYFYSQFQEKMLTRWSVAEDIIPAVSLGLWIAIMVRFELFALPDSVGGIVLRFATSVFGCCGVIGLLSRVSDQGNGIETKTHKVLGWFGCHSLEVYLLHGLLINLILPDIQPNFGTSQGLILTFGNYVLSLIIVVAIITLLNKNIALRFALFGKRT